MSGIYQIYTIHNNMTDIYLSYTHIITFLQVPDVYDINYDKRYGIIDQIYDIKVCYDIIVKL